jgi:hypothetical protein
MSQKLEINKSKVCLVKSSFGQHFRCTVPDCVTFPILSFLFVIDQNDSFFKPKLITFPENPLSKYLMGMVDFNKQDIDKYRKGYAIGHCATEMLTKATFNQTNF